MPETTPDSPSERDQRDLAALADGTLPEQRRAEVESRVAASPALGEELRQQQRAVAALREIDVAVPARLRARVEDERRSRAGSRRPRLAWAGAGAAAVAAAAVAVVVLAGGAGAPTVTEVAQVASLPPTEPAPQPRADQPTLLAADAEGLAYPNWTEEFGWRAAGERGERVGDRETTTVFYDKEGNRIAYTIVSGEPLEPAAGAATTTVDGVEFAVAREGERTIVTWLRDGHTCVLSGADVERRTLVDLAAWKGDGAVAF